ncbi:hypothetical protein VTK56DRAFT_3577 [Thermocarpiscus australiensis]
MSQPSAPCVSLDDSFGPHADDCRGGFDFTLLFEEAILTLLPLGLLLHVIPPRIWFLLKRAKKVAAGKHLDIIKISAWIALGALQLAVLVLWTTRSAVRTRATLAAAVLTLASTLGFCLLSYVEHGRAVQPSSLLNTYLLITLLFDIARARTLWLRATDGLNQIIAYVFSAAVAVKACVLVLEALEKRRLLRPEYRAYPPEATSSIFNRSSFWWLNPLFRLGFARVLDIDDLFVLDKHLQASYCHKLFLKAWKSQLSGTINNEMTQVGYGLIGAYLLVYVGIAVSMGQYQHRTYRAITIVRGGLVSLIYRKTGAVSLLDVDPAASMTLMSADMERTVHGWQTRGVACVVPVAISIFAMNFIVSRQAMCLEAIEKRISATSAMLASMKGVKMCGLQDTPVASLQQLQVDELRISKKFRKLIIGNMIFAYVTQVLAPVLTFTIFSVRARDAGDKTLDTARVFTALSLFALLSEPLASLVMALAAFLGAVGSFTRIQQSPHDLPGEKKPSKSGTTAVAITVRDADFGWDDPAKPPLLRGITLSVPRAKFTVVVGPVGCGKSTLQHALLGEIPALAGEASIGSSASVAYCAQSPWRMNGTVREAIVGGEQFDAKWYARVSQRIC